MTYIQGTLPPFPLPNDYEDFTTAIDEWSRETAKYVETNMETVRKAVQEVIWEPGTLDHGDMTGLTDDDHSSLYLLLSGARKLTGNWDVGGYNITNIGTGTFGKVGIGTTSPDSIFHIKANVAGTVGSHPAGQLIIQDPDDTVFGNAVITGYESDGAGNPDQQLWYLGSSSSSNSDIIFLNRRNSKLQLGTNGVSHLTILGNGNIGIGTTDPQVALDVVGAITGTSITFENAEYISNAVDGVIQLGSTGGTFNHTLDIDLDYNASTLTIGSTASQLFWGVDFALGDDKFMYMGNAPDVFFRYKAWTTYRGLQIGTRVGGTTNNSGHICIVEKADMDNANREPGANATDPTLRIYSADAAQANDYIDFCHNQTDGVIKAGNGDIKIDDDLNVTGTALVGGTLDVVGNIDPTTFETTRGGFLNAISSPYAQDKVVSEYGIQQYTQSQISSWTQSIDLDIWSPVTVGNLHTIVAHTESTPAIKLVEFIGDYTNGGLFQLQILIPVDWDAASDILIKALWITDADQSANTYLDIKAEVLPVGSGEDADGLALQTLTNDHTWAGTKTTGNVELLTLTIDYDDGTAPVSAGDMLVILYGRGEHTSFPDATYFTQDVGIISMWLEYTRKAAA